MKLTNKNNLPKVFEKILDSQYESKPNSFGATTLLKPVQEIILERRYSHEMIEDIGNRIPMLIGTAVHDYLERHDDDDYVEMYLKHEIIPNYFVSGKIDKYDENSFSVVDYKTAKVNKIVHEDFDDWRMQGLIYAWLLYKNKYHVEKIRFIALLKDWSMFAYNHNYSSDRYYPDSGVYVYEFKVDATSIKNIDDYLTNKMTQIRDWQNLKDKDLLEKPIEEKWQPKKTYAVIKNGKKRARKVFDKKDHALQDIRDDETIEERIESPSKLDLFCNYIQHTKNKIRREFDESNI